MAEENKTSSTQANETNAKTTATKSRTETKAKTTKTEDEKALTLSVQPREMLPRNRPVEPSHIEIVHTYSSVGSDRPVSKGTVKFSSTLAISGNRPIAASTLQISDTYIMGKRPIASNESDDTASLMGYLD